MRKGLVILALVMVMAGPAVATENEPIPLPDVTVWYLAAWHQAWALEATGMLTLDLLGVWRWYRDNYPCQATLPCPPPPQKVTRSTIRAVAEPSGVDTGMGGDVEQWRSLVAAYFPAEQVDAALRIMACESGGNPNAYNPSGASGLMQVLSSWADNFGYAPADLFIPEVNLRIARYLYDDSINRGLRLFSHWVCRP